MKYSLCKGVPFLYMKETGSKDAASTVVKNLLYIMEYILFMKVNAYLAKVYFMIHDTMFYKTVQTPSTSFDSF